MSFIRNWLRRFGKSVRQTPICKRPLRQLGAFEVLEDRTAPAAGDVDPSFGFAGMLVRSVQSTTSSTATAAGFARQSTGNLVVAATDQSIISVYIPRYNRYVQMQSRDIVLFRVSESSGAATAFNFNRKATNDAVSWYYANANDIAIQSGDDKILVAGSGDLNAARTGEGNSKAVLWRFLADGSLDTSFGAGGYVAPDLGTGSYYGVSVVHQSDDNKIVLLAGESGSSSRFLLMRFHADGSKDTSFGGGDGVAEASFGVGVTPTAMMRDFAGVTVVGATNAVYPSKDRDIALARFREDGSLDSNFSGDGMQITALSTGADVATSITNSTTSYPLIVGADTVSANGGNDFAMLWYNYDGSLNTAYGSTSPGVTVTPVSSGTINDYSSKVLTLPSGTIYQVGIGQDPATTSGYGSWHQALARFESKGTLDTTFGNAGTRLHGGRFGLQMSIADAMLMSDNRIITLGVQLNQIALTRFVPFNESTLDLGDAPDSYGTRLGSNGARHSAGGPMLGIKRDTEEDDAITLNSYGDDNYRLDDEDGLSGSMAFVPGQSANLTVQVSGGAAKLDAWVDYNRDGVFHPTNERITPAAGASMTEGVNTLAFTPPADVQLGSTYTRFRLSTAGGLNPTGAADDGEVEDHIMTFGIPPRIETVTPDFRNSWLQTGVRDVRIALSMLSNYSNDNNSYAIVSTGADGWLGTADDQSVPFTLVQELSSIRYRLVFNTPLQDGFYRLIVKDKITGGNGIQLDGNGDGVPGGNFVRDFIVGSGAATFTSPQNFAFRPQVTGANAGQLAGGTGDLFNGFGRLRVGGQGYTPTTATTPSVEVQTVTSTSSAVLDPASYTTAAGLSFTVTQAGVYQLVTYLYLEKINVGNGVQANARYAVNGIPISTRRYSVAKIGDYANGLRKSLYLQEYLTLQIGDVVTVQTRAIQGDVQLYNGATPHLMRIVRYLTPSFGQPPAIYQKVISSTDYIDQVSSSGKPISGLTLTAPTSGWYRVSSTLIVGTSNTYSVGFRINGVAQPQRWTEQSSANLDAYMFLSAGDVVDVAVFQTSSGISLSTSDDQVLRLIRLGEAPHIDPVLTTFISGSPGFSSTYSSVLSPFVAPASGWYRVGATIRYQADGSMGRLRFTKNGQPIGGQHEYLMQGRASLDIEEWIELEEGDIVQIQGKSDSGTVYINNSGESYSSITVTPIRPFTNPIVDGIHQELTTATQSLANWNVKREVFVPGSGNHTFARTVDVFTNPTATTTTRTVRIDGNFGYNVDTQVFLTSDGDDVVEATDQWIGFDDLDGQGLPATIIYLSGSRGLRPTSVSVEGDNLWWDYSLTLDPNETARLAYFAVVADTRDAVFAAATEIVGRNGFTGKAGELLSGAELATLKNWQFYHAPSDITLSDVVIAENMPSGTEIGYLTAVDVDSDGHLFEFVEGTGGQDNGAFILDGVFLRSNLAFDYEQKPTYSIRIRATDSDGQSVERVLTIQIQNSNDRPTLSLVNPTLSLVENTNIPERRKVAGIVISDDALGNETISLTGADAHMFEIIAGELYLKPGYPLNYESNPVLNVSIEADDPTIVGSPDATLAFTLNLTNINEAPILTEQGFSVPEHSAANTFVGSLIATDPEGDDSSLTFSATGGTGFGIFSVTSDGQIRLVAPGFINFESAIIIYTLHIRITDSSSPAFSTTAVISIAVRDANDAPTITNSTATLPAISEDAFTNTGVLVRTLTAVTNHDVDYAAAQGLAIITASNSGGKWQYSLNNGSTWLDVGVVSEESARLLAADAITRVRFLPTANFNGSVSFVYRAWDRTTGANGTLADSWPTSPSAPFSSTLATARLTVAAVNDAPINTIRSAMSLYRNGSIAFTGTNEIRIADVDAASGIMRITLTATRGTLVLSSATGLSSASGNNTGTLVLNGTLAAINAALKRVSYRALASFVGVVDIKVTTTDLGNTGWGGAKIDADTIRLTITNRTPTVKSPLPSTSYAARKNTTLTVLAATGVLKAFTDADGDRLTAALVTPPSSTKGTLTLRSDGSFTFVPKPNVIGPVTFTVRASDGVGFSPSITFTIVIA